MLKMYRRNSAFTLVELSIVLVIIGLIVASVTAGKALIRSAEIRALITQINSIETGVNSFLDRYNAIPGDFNNAFTVFGGASVPGCTTTACNGNGNFIIDYYGGSSNKNYEPYNLFLHLSLSGLTDGSYDGTNLPKVKYKGKAIFLGVRYAYGDAITGIFGRAGHAIHIGTLDPTSQFPVSIGLTPSEAQEIDAKIDDGVANTGKVYGVGGGSGCASWSAGTDYNLTVKTPACWLAYWMISM